MMAAKAYPDPEGVGRGKKGSVAEHFPMVSRARLSEARAVLRSAPDLADAVIAGAHSLDAAGRLRMDVMRCGRFWAAVAPPMLGVSP
jgi:hypothetical protein